MPEIGKKLASKAHREGVAERCPAPAVQQSMEVARALIGSSDHLLSAVERPLVTAAQPHDAQPLSVRQTVPGIGTILSLVLLYEMHDIQRCPRVQDGVSSCRLVQCAKASAGKRYGTSGSKSGNAYLQWAFSEAAGLLLRDNPAGQHYRARLEQKPGTGQALTVLAPQLGRAVYSLLRRNTGVDMDHVLHG